MVLYPDTMEASGQIKTSHVLYVNTKNSEVGGLRNSSLSYSERTSEKPFEQEGLLEYHDNKENAIAKYHKLFQVEHQRISCIIAFHSDIITYQRTDYSLEDITSNKALFWEFDAQGRSTCMTEGFRKFVIGIWEGLLYLNQQNIGIQYKEDFKKIYLVEGKLSEPKLYIHKVTECTDKVEDLKQKAAYLISIILGVRGRQGLLSSHRGLENFKKTLDVIHCCRFPMEAVKYHPEISGTDGKIQNMNTVYDRWISDKAQMKSEMKSWFGTLRRVNGRYSSWSTCLGDGDVGENPYGSRVISMFKAKRERYISGNCASEPNCDVDYLSGLVILMRDLFNHANDDVTEPEDEMTDEDILHYFDMKFPNLCFELHHYIFKINPAR